MARPCERCDSREDLTPLDGLWICSDCSKEYSQVKKAFVSEGSEEELPNYLKNPLRKTSSQNLKTVVSVAASILEERFSDPREEEIEAGEGEEIVEIQEQSAGPTKVVKKIPCGKDCNGCPHGPYEYSVQRTGEGLSWEYIGPAE